MNNKVSGLTLLVLLLFFGCQSVLAESPSNALQTMAKIMLHLNHYPSGSEKGTLRKLIKEDSTTAHERVLATAMINLQHKATASDKKKLRKLLDGNSLSASEMELAKIIFSLSHQPTARDREKLKKIIR